MRRAGVGWERPFCCPGASPWAGPARCAGPATRATGRRSSIGGEERGDLTRSLRLNLHNRAFTVGGFSPQLSMVKEERTSNAQLHDYERLSGELRFVQAVLRRAAAVQRPPDLHERVARIEERMATREELDALRAAVERRDTAERWLRGTLSTAAIAAGFLALLLVFTG